MNGAMINKNCCKFCKNSICSDKSDTDNPFYCNYGNLADLTLFYTSSDKYKRADWERMGTFFQENLVDPFSICGNFSQEDG